eukprot:Awhi_evm1s6464
MGDSINNTLTNEESSSTRSTSVSNVFLSDASDVEDDISALKKDFSLLKEMFTLQTKELDALRKGMKSLDLMKPQVDKVFIRQTISNFKSACMVKSMGDIIGFIVDQRIENLKYFLLNHK